MFFSPHLDLLGLFKGPWFKTTAIYTRQSAFTPLKYLHIAYLHI